MCMTLGSVTKHYAKIKETPHTGSRTDGFKTSGPQSGEDLSISVMEAPPLPAGRSKTVGHLSGKSPDPCTSAMGTACLRVGTEHGMWHKVM